MEDSSTPTRRSPTLGERFGKRLIIKILPYKKDPAAGHVLCRCDCGREKRVKYSCLLLGEQTACNFCRPQRGKHRGTANRENTPEWEAWSSMRKRCNNPNHPAYHHYGGRGITICATWADYRIFLQEMGPRPSTRHSLDRIDNSIGYSATNCRWATWDEQGNNRRSNCLLTFDGRTQTIRQWSVAAGINHRTISHRLKNGWSVEDTLTRTPIKGKKKPG